MSGPRLLCMGCQKEIALASIPFCADCTNLMDPEFAREVELSQTLRGLKGAKDHITNSAGGCVSWCPVCNSTSPLAK